MMRRLEQRGHRILSDHFGSPSVPEGAGFLFDLLEFTCHTTIMDAAE